LNYYPFHLGDYAAHTAHLEPMEDLAYRRMLDLYYRIEQPLPEAAEIARLIRMRDHAATIRDVLNEFFDESPDGYRHARCDAEIARMQDKQAKARASAHASVSVRSTNAQRTLNERSTNVELPTPTPTPKEDSEAKASGGKPPQMTPEEIIFGYGVPLLVSAGSTDKAARSFLGGLRKAQRDDGAIVNALRECIRAKPLQPLEWLAAAMPPAHVGGKQTALERRNAAVAAELGAKSE
jgi:uncharacterized protein YdaU (DUF1376 family)